jgi:hypothetical protein
MAANDSFGVADGELLMIKLKVEWRQKCPGCGVQLVVDFLTDAYGCRVCPWCGCNHNGDLRTASEEVQEFVTRSMNRLEGRANRLIANGG